MALLRSLRHAIWGVSVVGAIAGCHAEEPLPTTEDALGATNRVVEGRHDVAVLAGDGVRRVLTASAVPTNNLRFVSTFLQAGTLEPDQNYLPEINGSNSPLDRLSGVHMSPSFFRDHRDQLGLTRAIIDLGPSLFQSHGVLIDTFESELNRIGSEAIDGHRDRVLAFYVADEPTGQEITRSTLERLLAAIHRRFPGIPTYLVYAEDCFDNAPQLDTKCGLPGQRGIPSNLDWVGFDWYLRETLPEEGEIFARQIEGTLLRLLASTDKPVVLVSEGMNEFLQDKTPSFQDFYLSRRTRSYLSLAAKYPRVIGMDNYIWADHREGGVYVSGARNFPSTKRTLFDAAGPLINRTLEGNAVLDPPRDFDGAFRVHSDGQFRRYYKAAGNAYFCSLGPGEGTPGEPIFTDIRGLYDNGPCQN